MRVALIACMIRIDTFKATINIIRNIIIAYKNTLLTKDISYEIFPYRFEIETYQQNGHLHFDDYN